MNILKKITMKDTQLGKSKLLAMDIQEEMPVMQVAGIAHDVKSGTSTYGEWHAALGQFWARNLLTGDEYVASSLILPPLAQNLIVEALRGAEQVVEFAYVISAIPDNSRGDRNIKYGIKPVKQLRERDDVSGLKALFAPSANGSATVETEPENSVGDSAFNLVEDEPETEPEPEVETEPVKKSSRRK